MTTNRFAYLGWQFYRCVVIGVKIDTTGKETILYSFGDGTDGFGPNSGVIVDAAGNLYGTTLEGGAFNSGTIFKIAP